MSELTCGQRIGFVTEKTTLGVAYSGATITAGAAVVDAMRLCNIPPDRAHHKLYKEIMPALQAQGRTLTPLEEGTLYRSFSDQAFYDMGGYGRGTADLGIVLMALCGALLVRNGVRRIKENVQNFVPHLQKT